MVSLKAEVPSQKLLEELLVTHPPAVLVLVTNVCAERVGRVAMVAKLPVSSARRMLLRGLHEFRGFCGMGRADPVFSMVRVVRGVLMVG